MKGEAASGAALQFLFKFHEAGAAVDLEELAKMCQVLKAKIVGYLLHTAVSRHELAFGLHYSELVDVIFGGVPGCLFDAEVEVVGGYSQFVCIMKDRVFWLLTGFDQSQEAL